MPHGIHTRGSPHGLHTVDSDSDSARSFDPEETDKFFWFGTDLD